MISADGLREAPKKDGAVVFHEPWHTKALALNLACGALSAAGFADEVSNAPLAPKALPAYAAGRVGTIATNHGPHVLPNSNARFQRETPQPLYTVSFTAKPLR